MDKIGISGQNKRVAPGNLYVTLRRGQNTLKIMRTEYLVLLTKWGLRARFHLIQIYVCMCTYIHTRLSTNTHINKDSGKYMHIYIYVCIYLFTRMELFNIQNLYLLFSIYNIFCILFIIIRSVSSLQLLSCVWLFATQWTEAHQASLSITNYWSLPKLMSIELYRRTVQKDLHNPDNHNGGITHLEPEILECEVK